MNRLLNFKQLHGVLIGHKHPRLVETLSDVYSTKVKSNIPGCSLLSLAFGFLLLYPQIAKAQTNIGLRVIVNSNQDGPVQAEDKLTLREAIEIVNGTLPVDKLSSAQKAQVQPLTTNPNSHIEFNLDAGATTIALQKELPALITPGLVIDGTTQTGYNAGYSETAEIAIPTPVVAITSAAHKEVYRGLTVAADGVTIRGLSLYGFSAFPQKQLVGSLQVIDGPKDVTLTSPPGDILISHRLPPPNTTQQQPPNSDFAFGKKDIPPKNIVIEDNWLGIPPSPPSPLPPSSAFGVYVFNSTGTTIRRNRIYNHTGSGIITSVRAENTQVTENIIVGNGINGMPDGVHLEGVVTNSQIKGNLICANDGAGVYLFKPEGKVQIQDNQITYNGRRLRSAAVYLMGSDHQVTGNQIRYQTGSGVVVSAFPGSIRNTIENNQFSGLEGLSIDLNTQQNLDVSDFQRGDGPNPKRNSPNRRLETGNAAINAPEFTAKEFTSFNGQLQVVGKADPGSVVQIYRVTEKGDYGPLSEPLGSVAVDAQGRFATSVNINVGEQISAIATDPKYGTSESAANATIFSYDRTPPLPPRPIPPIPQCTTAPQPQAPQPTPIPNEPLRIQVPRNIHFALDKANLSPTSAAVLDRVVNVLRSIPVIVVEIQGHTDPRASEAYNLDLGKRRAISVRNYLLQHGIAPERLTIRSFGERKLKAPGNLRVDYARDRRVELLFQDIRGLELTIEEQEDDLQIEHSTK